MPVRIDVDRALLMPAQQRRLAIDDEAQVSGPDELAAQNRRALHYEKSIGRRRDGRQRVGGRRLECEGRDVVEEVAVQSIGDRLERLAVAIDAERELRGNSGCVGRALVDLRILLVGLQKVEAA